MTTIADKVHHVLNAPEGDGRHRCHWPGCQERCKPAFFSCRRHWFTWPRAIRTEIWACYQTGQEVSKTPSLRYLQVARAAEAWALDYERRKSETVPPQGSLDL